MYNGGWHESAPGSIDSLHRSWSHGRIDGALRVSVVVDDAALVGHADDGHDAVVGLGRVGHALRHADAGAVLAAARARKRQRVQTLFQNKKLLEFCLFFFPAAKRFQP